jgi:predicted metal-dependent phosphoesterase TrpH
MIIDLHTHSHFSSDGRYTVDELLDLYEPGAIVGLTDHETIEGWSTFTIGAELRGLIPVPGVEWFSDDCHILSYFVGQPTDAFFDFMRLRRAKERECMARLHTDLTSRYPALPPYVEVLGLHAHPEGILGIPALTDALSAAANMPPAEARALIRTEKRSRSYQERPRPFFRAEIVEQIRKWEGTPVLAHPYAALRVRGARREPQEVEALVAELVQHGLAGVEIVSGDSREAETAHLLGLCQRFDLIPTLGSDFHDERHGRHPSSLTPPTVQVRQKVESWLYHRAPRQRSAISE